MVGNQDVTISANEYIILGMKRRLPKRYRRYVQSFLLVVPMTGIVTSVNILVAKGLEAIVTVATLKKWGICILVAFPMVLLIQPLAVKFTDQLVKDD